MMDLQPTPPPLGLGRPRPLEANMPHADATPTVVRDKLRTDKLRAWFGKVEAIKQVSLRVAERKVTAIIGPSGCGKSTFLRCLNRMHEVVPGTRVEGKVLLDDVDIYERRTDPVKVRALHRDGVSETQPIPQIHIQKRSLRPANPGVTETRRDRRQGGGKPESRLALG